ncbi:MAG: hypothetical protein ACJ76J_01515 [Thermoanaerobaculia bacterium]
MQTGETHPAPEQIERFALGDCGLEESRLVVSHLLRGCPECQRLARAAWYRTGSELARLVLLPIDRHGAPPQP